MRLGFAGSVHHCPSTMKRYSYRPGWSLTAFLQVPPLNLRAFNSAGFQLLKSPHTQTSVASGAKSANSVEGTLFVAIVFFAFAGVVAFLTVVVDLLFVVVISLLSPVVI